MEASLKQLASRRRVNRITRREIQRRLERSYSWVRCLEEGIYNGPCVSYWRDLYENALLTAINEKKAKENAG